MRVRGPGTPPPSAGGPPPHPPRGAGVPVEASAPR